MATGALSMPKALEIPEIDRYQGNIYHTSDWPHENVAFTDQRLGVIGTGSSGIQTIPLVAAQAAHTTVFQRTPNFSLPAGNRPLIEEEIAERKANYHQWREAQRTSGFGVPVPAATKSALEATEEERNATYQAAWDHGVLVPILTAFTDLITDKAANDTAAEFVRAKIRQIVKDPAVAETLCPATYPIGVKRPCLDTGYYATFNKDNVHLIDLRKSPLVEFTEKGVRTTDREYEFDSIVLATGFDAVTGALTAIDIRGRGGVELADKWRAGPRSYLGIAVAGFPNLPDGRHVTTTARTCRVNRGSSWPTSAASGPTGNAATRSPPTGTKGSTCSRLEPPHPMRREEDPADRGGGPSRSPRVRPCRRPADVDRRPSCAAVSGQTLPNVDPATEQPLASVPRGDAVDVDVAVRAARRDHQLADRAALAGKQHEQLMAVHRTTDRAVRGAEPVQGIDGCACGCPDRGNALRERGSLSSQETRKAGRASRRGRSRPDAWCQVQAPWPGP
jgi:hypothetical protein